MDDKEGRVTGIGGVFFTSKNPEILKEWYGKNLHLSCDQYCHLLKWRLPDEPEKYGSTQWSIFDSKAE